MVWGLEMARDSAFNVQRIVTNAGVLGFLLLCGAATTSGQTADPRASGDSQARTHTWWRDAAPGQRPYTSNSKRMPLVAGFDWAYDLTPLILSAIAAEGIGYTAHPYANKRSQPWEPKWEEGFGFAAAKYPIIATEFGGFAMPPAPGAEPPGGRGATAAAYRPAIIQYLEGRGISWTVWCFDPEWGPTLIRNWNYELNASGQFAQAAMNGEIK